MRDNFEYIVIGSGPCGAQAAQTLAEAGKDVAVLDVGFADEHYKNILPDDDFENLRKNDPLQYRYFLGDKFETIPLHELKVGAQLTPPRKYIIKDVNKLIPLLSETFAPMESLAYGGLGAGWGLGCFVYSDKELTKAGLDASEIKKGYKAVSERIGISCKNDDATPYTTAFLENILPPLKMDNSSELLYNKYMLKKEKFAEHNIFMGNAPLAMLSVDYKNREKTEYKDMDFYSDSNWHAYRAWMTIEELKKFSHFIYIDKALVLRFNEDSGHVSIEAKNVETNEIIVFKCKKLLLATGPLGSARIVMRSFSQKIKRLPILCNPYTYLPCIHLGMLGKPLNRFKSSMAQMVMFYDKKRMHDDVVSVAMFTYRSLMLYKLVKEAPLNLADSRILMQYLQSAFMITGIHHPDESASEKYLELYKDDSSFTNDKLFAHYVLSDEEKKKVKNNERVIKRALRNLGCYPVMRMDPGYGSSIHYAGSLPFSKNKDEFGTTAFNGKLNGSQNIYMADGSGFLYLPAKGITFTIMANAYTVANNAMKENE
ncbi:MAG: hypothetical protein ABR968_11675 [Bacteroidales bacterium]|jgi:hypothetical protein